MDALFVGLRAGLTRDDNAWRVQRALLDFLESDWQRPDEGIWEVRGPARHFTHSKVMAWVAFDRAVETVERFGHDGPVDRWRARRDDIHRDVCQHGYDPGLGAFVQSYGSTDPDASLLMLPLVGFLPPRDPRMIGTVRVIEQQLMHHGLVRRYVPRLELDALEEQEGTFLLCTFWLADNLALQGRTGEAHRLFEHLLSLRNDVGLLSEQYDPVARRMLGNFPQAFSHVGLVNTANNLASDRAESPAGDRPG